jgi:ABC-type branched-subunit amino acid transport system substrate-binding protein
LPLAEKKIFLHIKDTFRDSARTQEHLAYLDSLRPDLVVGEIFNQQSRVIGEWAEATGTPQIVPLSPTPSLAEGKSYVFLAHPSAAGHGSYMATYAFEQLKLNKVAVWTDQRRQTTELAEAFSSTFDTLGGEVIPLIVDSVYSDSAREEIRDLVRSLRFQQVDGVYLPIQGNQEMAGLILSQMRIADLNVKVMGGPHWWQQYENIDRELKESYELLFTTSYMNDKADPVYQTFYQNYLKAYQFPPSVYGFHGYDMGMYVAQALDGFDYRNGQSLAAYLRNYPAYQGIHLAFDFRGKQQNQFVNIGKFGNERVEKVNAPQRIDLKRLFPEED